MQERKSSIEYDSGFDWNQRDVWSVAMQHLGAIDPDISIKVSGKGEFFLSSEIDIIKPHTSIGSNVCYNKNIMDMIQDSFETLAKEKLGITKYLSDTSERQVRLHYRWNGSAFAVVDAKFVESGPKIGEENG